MRPPSPPEPFCFFVDECLGRHVVPDAIRGAIEPGERVMLLPQGTADVDWLPRAGSEGWLCLTKDRRLLLRPNELAALCAARVAVFTLGDARAEEHAARIVAGLPIMRRAAKAIALAFVARVEMAGDLSIRVEDGRKLDKPRRFKAKPGERR